MHLLITDYFGEHSVNNLSFYYESISNFFQGSDKTMQTEQIKQFLNDEKELLKDLAVDVANAETDYELAKAKSIYSTQLARVSGIQDTMELVIKG